MKIIKQCILGGFTFLCMLLVLDVFLFSAQIETVSKTTFSPDLGRIRPDNMDYISLNEGFSFGHFNQGHYLNTYYPPRLSHESDVLRIALLGDSYVEGFQLFDHYHFRSLLENKLSNSSESLEHQVLNFGRSGFDLADMYACQSTLVSPYSPDICLFFVSEADLHPTQTDKLIPRVVQNENQLSVSTDFNETSVKNYLNAQKLLSVSVFANMLNKVRKTLTVEYLMSKLFDKFYSINRTSNERHPDYVNSSFELDTLTRKIVQTLDEHVIFVNRDDHPLNPEFVQLLRDSELQYIDLSIPLQQMYRDGIDPHYWNATNKKGHWNHEAHKKVSTYLYYSLSQLGIVNF